MDENIGEKKKTQTVPYLGESVFSNIFMRLPAHQLQTLRTEYKLWHVLISESGFIDNHFRSHSKPSLIALRSVEGNDLNTIDVLEIEDERIVSRSLNFKCRRVLDTCNGLVLLDNVPKQGDISVGNPLTQKRWQLPPFTKRGIHHYSARALVFIDSTREYKVVFAVNDDNGSIGCEILTLGSDTWKWVSAPDYLIWDDESGFVSIKGVIHLLGLVEEDVEEDQHDEYVISFDTVNERYYKTELPEDPGCLPSVDQLLEIGGLFSISSLGPSNSYDHLDIWVLKDLQRGEWVKHLSMNFDGIIDNIGRNLRPVRVMATFDNCKIMILECCYLPDDKWYIYDVLLQEVKPLEFNPEYFSVLPHVESLVSLDP